MTTATILSLFCSYVLPLILGYLKFRGYDPKSAVKSAVKQIVAPTPEQRQHAHEVAVKHKDDIRNDPHAFR